MPRIYRVPYTGTLTNSGGSADLLIIQPASNKPCRLAGWFLGQSSEVGDAQEEMIRITLLHMTATVTVTGGTAVTGVACRPVTSEWVAPGFTATCNCPTVATTSGTTTTMEEHGWNLRANPWERWIPEEVRPECINTEALIVRLESTLVDDITCELTFFVEEL